MSIRNWGVIQGGPTLEALMQSLVSSEDHQAKLFGRPGKDGGQDARSGDGSTVFQAKFIGTSSFDEAMKRAKEEARKIEKYRNPDHERSEQWKGVTAWTLVTNAVVNPTDDGAWTREVMPLFEKMGLSASYWDRSRLDARLDRAPDISAAFFEGQSRYFLSPSEARAWLLEQEPFLQKDTLLDFIGRENEIQIVEDFVRGPKRILVVHGPGGVGKTRFMLEAATEVASRVPLQVLWANVASMANSSDWFRGVVADRPTLLLVDEPDESFPFQAVLEQLATRAKQWKVIVTVRTPKDPVLRFFSSARKKKQTELLALDQLTSDEAGRFAQSLVDNSRYSAEETELKERVKSALIRYFSRFPIWMTMAMELLETGRPLAELPESAEALVGAYLEEIVTERVKQPAPVVLDYLRRLSLWSPFNRASQESLDALCKVVGAEHPTIAQSLITELFERKVVFARGAYERLIEVKPEVLRDHILEDWLTITTGYGSPPVQPTPIAIDLVEQAARSLLSGPLGFGERALLVSLGRLSLRLQLSGRPVSLLATLFSTVESELTQAAADVRVAILDELSSFAFYCPSETASLCRLFRESEAKTVTVDRIVRVVEVSQKDVNLALAWPLFNAAMGADAEQQTPIFRELLLTLALEQEIGKSERLPNDGKRAGDVLERILAGGPSFRSDFEAVILRITLEYLRQMARGELAPNLESVVMQLCHTQLKIERRWREHDVSRVITTINYVLPGHSSWDKRNEVVLGLRQVIESEQTPPESKMAAWAAVVRGYAELSRAVLSGNHENAPPSLLTDDLDWALSYLGLGKANLNEVTAARELWLWQLERGGGDVRELAEKLEKVYQGDELAAEFSSFFDTSCHHEEREARIAKRVEDAVAVADNTDDLCSFFCRFFKYLGSGVPDRTDTKVFLALKVGERAEEHEIVRGFIRNSISSPGFLDEVTLQKLARGWIGVLRNEDKDASELIAELLEAAGTEDLRRSLVVELLRSSDLTGAEIELLRTQVRLFEQKEHSAAFLSLIGRTCCWKFNEAQEIVKILVEPLSGMKCMAALSALVGGVLDAVWGKKKTEIPEDLSSWVLELVLTLEYPGSFWYQDEHKLTMITEKAGRPTLGWLLDKLEARWALLRHGGKAPELGIPYLMLPKWVEPVSSSKLDKQRETLEKLFTYCNDQLPIYYAHEILKELDKDGLLLPDIVAVAISNSERQEQRLRLGAYASFYPVGSAAWRMIAQPILKELWTAEQSFQWEWYSELNGYERTMGWSAPVGSVAEVFYQRVEAGQRSLDQEAEQWFRPFWEWRLEGFKEDLRDAEERAKEARGE